MAANYKSFKISAYRNIMLTSKPRIFNDYQTKQKSEKTNPLNDIYIAITIA